MGCGNTKLQQKNPSAFIPKDFVLYQKYNADLNADGLEDCLFLIKATNTKQIVVNRFGKKVDRNRRGVVILFKNNNNYQLIDKNTDCFASENEDGGVYYAPQLSVETDNGDIIFNYEHGRYGYWYYKFRLLNTQYKLIEYYHISTFGPKTISETTINFLTKEKRIKENINEDAEGNDEVFEDTTSTIQIEKLIKLSDIKDFEDLDLSVY